MSAGSREWCPRSLVYEMETPHGTVLCTVYFGAKHKCWRWRAHARSRSFDFGGSGVATSHRQARAVAERGGAKIAGVLAAEDGAEVVA